MYSRVASGGYFQRRMIDSKMMEASYVVCVVFKSLKSESLLLAQFWESANYCNSFGELEFAHLMTLFLFFNLSVEKRRISCTLVFHILEKGVLSVIVGVNSCWFIFCIWFQVIFSKIDWNYLRLFTNGWELIITWCNVSFSEGSGTYSKYVL